MSKTDWMNLQEPGARFNMALATLERMNDLIKYLRDATLSNNWTLAFKFIEELWSEVRPYAIGKRGVKKDEIDSVIEQTRRYYNQVSQSESKSNRTKYMPQESYRLLIVGIRSLRKDIMDLMNELGLLMPKADDPRFAAYG